jgi:hypothetical protein
VAWAALVHKSQSPDRKIFRVSVDDVGEPVLDLDGCEEDRTLRAVLVGTLR